MRLAPIAFVQKFQSRCENGLIEGSGFTAVGIRSDPKVSVLVSSGIELIFSPVAAVFWI